MDTSKEYINMCEKAVEIQKLWKPKAGDFQFEGTYDNGDEVYVLSFKDIQEDEFYRCWLPRQDQLQEIVSWDFVGFSKNGGMEVYQHREQKYSLDYGSMEQLWLAFVMKEKYHKIWNGEVWEYVGGHCKERVLSSVD